MRRFAALLTISTLLAAATACGSASTSTSDAGSAPHTVHGTLTVYDGKQFPAHTGACNGGKGGYQDLTTGSQITMKDESGKLVGVGEFGPGRLSGRGGCTLTFTVPNVGAAKFYTLATTGTNRAPRSISATELASDHWRMNLSVGDSAQAELDSGYGCMDHKLFTPTVVAYRMGTPSHHAGGLSIPVTVTVRVTSTASRDATVLLDWALYAWDRTVSMSNEIGFGRGQVQVPAGGSETVRLVGKADEDVFPGEFDLSRTAMKSYAYQGSLVGTHPDCRHP